MKMILRASAAWLALAAVPADAATYVFNLFGASELYGVVDVSFQLDSNPTPEPTALALESFRINNVAISYNGGTPIGGHQVAFFDAASGGGLEFLPVGGGPGPAGTWSPAGIELFTGGIVAPQFKLGTFRLNDYWNPQMGYRLTITALAEPTTPVPEPASWAMMIAGFAITGAALRRSQSARRSLATA